MDLCAPRRPAAAPGQRKLSVYAAAPCVAVHGAPDSYVLPWVGLTMLARPGRVRGFPCAAGPIERLAQTLSDEGI